MPMMITAVTAPTRGPDYIAPVAPGGTPKVTKLAAVPVVATDPSPAALSPGNDITLADERRKKLLRVTDRAPPQPDFTKSSVAMTPLWQDIPLGGIMARQAARAYQSQRRLAGTPASGDTAISDETTIAPTAPVSVSLYQPEEAPGGLDVKA